MQSPLPDSNRLAAPRSAEVLEFIGGLGCSLARLRGDGMYRVIRSGELRPSPTGTVKFEGEPYSSGVSLFLVNNEPGDGPDLHRHPYSETWIVRSGTARFTADGEDVEAGPGDILVVATATPHKFKNVGTDRLDIICIHSAPRIVQEELEE
jgi:mannose-6-phosphate isomerase-like protein (cupin superfamily)